ncbi:hypothetical protein GE21DRAFT_1292190 [Neurospora crassa]|nr:hypothetical protein GE21DRAFT_1292190 [Neurospora crassa]
MIAAALCYGLIPTLVMTSSVHPSETRSNSPRRRQQHQKSNSGTTMAVHYSLCLVTSRSQELLAWLDAKERWANHRREMAIVNASSPEVFP